jgi:hypothetical protein
VFNYNPGRWDVKSPLTYRGPLPAYLWLALGNGTAIGVAWAFLAGLSMFAAYFAAEKLVAPLAAVAAPLGLAMVFGMTVWHPVRLLWAEVWAAPFVVAAAALAALVLWSAEAGGRTRAWLLAGAGGISALAALLCRELALVPILIMGLALLLSPKVRRAYLWTPWLAAVLAWAAQYAWQVQEVRTLTAELPAIKPNWSLADYFFNGPEQLFAAIRWASSEIYVVAFVAIFCIMAAAAAFTVRSASLRVLVGGLTLGILGLMLLVGPPVRTFDGRLNGYWGFLFVPIVIAWAPLALRFVPGMAPGASDGTRADWVSPVTSAS